MSIDESLTSLFVVALVAAIVPIVVGLLPRVKVPQVVWLLIGGIIIGPEMLSAADPAAIDLLSQVGLGFLFLLAGYELDPQLLRERVMRRAGLAWVVTALVSLVVTSVLELLGIIETFVVIAIGLTTTALGTILPIAKDAGILNGPLAKPLVANGAVGEFLPIIAIALFLGSSGRFVALITIAIFGLIAVLVVNIPKHAVPRVISDIVSRGTESTKQTTLRLVVVLLLGLLVVANDLGLDTILGAFAAGIVLRLSKPKDIDVLEHKLDAIGYGFFIPIFFIASGMSLDIDSIVENPLRLVLFFVLLLAVRGGTVYFMHFNLPRGERRQLALFAATALPLLVALAEIGQESGHMLAENAAALVGAGVLTVLMFPLLALRGTQPTPAAEAEEKV